MEIGTNHPRILIIDDEPVVLESCVEILADEPYEVATADNGAWGLEMVEEFCPDLVFVDLKMPGISGMHVLDSIAREHPTVVTVVITGYATVDSAIEAMKKGAYDFLPKPFTPDQFRLITSRAVEKRRLVLETIALRREKEVLRENFAAIVSHELKSPLSAVQQNLFVLASQLSSVATKEQLHQVDRMKDRVADLLKMVNTWLRGVSTDVNGIRERFEVLPVSVPIAKAIENVEQHAIRKNVKILVEESAGSVFGDEGTLTEALTNIIGNAVKYSYEGGSVSVATRSGADRVRVEIVDSGIGIPKGDQAHVFDDFYRAAAASDEAGGAGLGLAISRRIIEAHSGSVSVESQVGEGTTVTVLLPSRQSEGSQLDDEIPGGTS